MLAFCAPNPSTVGFYATQAVVASPASRASSILRGCTASSFKAGILRREHGVIGIRKSPQSSATVGITVNAICPGVVMTELDRGQAAHLVTSFGGGISEEEALERASLDAMPTRRFIEPDAVGALCASLR